MAIGDIQQQNDTPLGVADISTNQAFYRLPVVGEPDEGDTIVYAGAVNGFIPIASADANVFVATDDAGDGTVEGDCNATDFTGQSPIVGQAALIAVNATVNFVHKAINYAWVGPQPVTVGVGGSHVAVAGDFAATGTTDHALFTNRDAADQHPQSAITDLVTDQAAQDAALQAHLDDLTQSAHTQFTMIDDALNTFTSAGYGGVRDSTLTALSDITSTYQTLPADTGNITVPLYVTQDTAGSGIRFQREGIWNIQTFISLSHNEGNSSRTMVIRLYNVTDDITASTIAVGVGRNNGVTNVTTAGIAEIPASAVGDLFVVQVGSIADTFTSVTQISYSFNVFHVSQATALEV